ncbi:MAG: cell division protein SepF, partial [Firmicutes bacterium]|nr:cell division protein SepF [Bacillota bacterium]
MAKRFMDRVLNFIGFEAEPEEELDFAEEPEAGPQSRKQRG